MKNETLLELFNFYGSAHILHNHRRGRAGGSLKSLGMIMGEGEGSWPYDNISKNNFFSQNEIVLKHKTINN